MTNFSGSNNDVKNNFIILLLLKIYIYIVSILFLKKVYMQFYKLKKNGIFYMLKEHY